MRYEELCINPAILKDLATNRKGKKFPDVLRCCENAAARGEFSLTFYTHPNYFDSVEAILDDLGFEHRIKASSPNEVAVEITWGDEPYVH